MDRSFTVREARKLMPEVLARASEVIALRADLVELQSALAAGAPSSLGSLPEAKGLQARLSELLAWFPAQGLDVKGLAPLLLDFPAQLDGESVLLCWIEGEPVLGWYHKAELGFAGRRVILDPFELALLARPVGVAAGPRRWQDGICQAGHAHCA